ncbi:glycosyltransferase family 20 protein [Myriangium duriaei CBS 260.36]|uniref:Glycosyltransferase family 20 protein n=1 Tax=Myriangium duriaei CBS 260.36 TaxID=1168546 RepID=A0A9P4J4Y1_9PEZI|nr:glycosyltransferase family 20 protein [Myriangium duriaei CBS 260.36]
MATDDHDKPPESASLEGDDRDTELRPTQSKSSAASFRSDSISSPSSFVSVDESTEPQSLVGALEDPSKINLKVHPKDYPRLELSGRIISASYCLPHNFVYTHNENEPWTLGHRPGTSAMFDSFQFLSSHKSSWKHLHIGWTGEILQKRSRKGMTIEDMAIEDRPPLSRLSAPVPLNGGPINPQLDPSLRISRADRNRLEQKLGNSRGNRMVPVWLPSTISDDGNFATFRDQTKWRHYSEHELFQLFHYKFPQVTDGRTKLGRWEDYRRMNKAFADRILETYSPGDIVMIHDYHLLLIPAMLRARVGDMKISLFLHIPFPNFEYFRCLAQRRDILLGMLGSDMIAFQAISYADHFKSCCQQLLPGHQSSVSGVEAQGRHVNIEILPVGINTETLVKAAFSEPNIDLKVSNISNGFQGKKIIVGRDRVDPTRGVVQKLQAFYMFLDRYPEWRGKVILIQITAEPSIEDKERGGEENAKAIARMVKAINGRFGTVGHIPVRHFSTYIPKEEYYALLRAADLGLITSVRDGMNTTSLEFVTTQKKNHSPLLLSEFSGTSSNLNGAIHINPWDLLRLAKAINDALLMSDRERQAMYNVLTPTMQSNSVQKWVEKSLRRLCVHMDVHEAGETRPALDIGVVLKYFSPSTRRLFVFDYDGTLTPIVEDPSAALPSGTLLNHLKTIAADKRNAVWIVSGRDQDFLTKWLGSIEGLGLSAEHGSFMKYPHSNEWINLTEREDMGWQPKVLELARGITQNVPGSVLERKRVAITWHYRRADPKLGSYNAKALTNKIQRSISGKYDVEVMTGKANIEVRPRSINKGQVVRRLVNDFGAGAGKAPDFVLCVGDDTTDEDMFRALRLSELPMTNVFGIVVGHSTKRSMASWRVDAPEDVIDLLGHVVEGRETAFPSPKS